MFSGDIVLSELSFTPEYLGLHRQQVPFRQALILGFVIAMFGGVLQYTKFANLSFVSYFIAQLSLNTYRLFLLKQGNALLLPNCHSRGRELFI